MSMPRVSILHWAIRVDLRVVRVPARGCVAYGCIVAMATSAPTPSLCGWLREGVGGRAVEVLCRYWDSRNGQVALLPASSVATISKAASVNPARAYRPFLPCLIDWGRYPAMLTV